MVRKFGIGSSHLRKLAASLAGAQALAGAEKAEARAENAGGGAAPVLRVAELWSWGLLLWLLFLLFYWAFLCVENTGNIQRFEPQIRYLFDVFGWNVLVVRYRSFCFLVLLLTSPPTPPSPTCTQARPPF